jgi:prolyl oligopeptidase
MPLRDSIYPAVEEIIHGVAVSDPYRWLEDRSLPDTEKWIVDQRRRCEEYFAECGNPDVLRDRVREYLDVQVVDQPARVGGRYFYRRRNQGEEQASLYMRDSATGTERLLVDPSALGPFVSVGVHRISDKASLLAYELKYGGGDKRSIHVLNVESGRPLSACIATGYASGFSFTSDRLGFYYCHEVSEPSPDHTVCLHLVEGTASDQVCFRTMRSRGSRLIFTADGTHLGAIHIHRAGEDDVLDLWIAEQGEPKKWRHVLENRSLPFTPILKLGRIFALTYDDAPNGRFIEIDITGAEMRTIIPEGDGVIRQLVVAGDRIFVNRMDRMCPLMQRWSLSGEYLGCLDIPNDSDVELLPNPSESADTIFYTCESFTQPLSIFEYTIANGATQLWHQRSLPADSLTCWIRRTLYTSKDGTEVPITVVGPQRRRRAGPSATLMTSYGGFGVAMTPQFSVLVAIMMELGVTFALPSVRGGGEFGRAWHETARGRNRQIAFDDFVAAAEWLCKNGTTTPDQLAIFGGSNSGLLVGAAMTQRPDLFRTVLCIAPLLDMVRYESFDHASKWRQEYGSVEDSQDFQALYAYSPYHRVSDVVDYPSVLFVSGDRDDRCNPAHVRKMAARLQNRDVQRSSIVVDYSEERGHSPVLPLTVRVDALTRRIMFLCRELDISVDFGGRCETTCV